jgi:hypothetical protein
MLHQMMKLVGPLTKRKSLALVAYFPAAELLDEQTAASFYRMARILAKLKL